MNFGELVAKGGALFLKKKLSAVQAVYDAAPVGEKAAFQSSVSKDWADVIPVGGIPSSDMSASVRESIGKADTALQSVSAANVYAGQAGINGLVLNGSGQSLTNLGFSSLTFNSSDYPFGAAGCFANVTGANQVHFSDAFLPVDANSIYQVVSDVKQLARAASAGAYYMGLALYDVDGNIIDFQHAGHVPGSETTLAAPLAVGDTTISLTSGANWRNVDYVFNAVKFFTYRDSLGRLYKRSINPYSRHISPTAWGAGGVSGNTITLSSPWAYQNPEAGSGGVWAAGTEIACAQGGNTFNYRIALGLTASMETWERKSAYLGGGFDTSGLASDSYFRPGTAKVKFVILINYGGTDTDVTGFGNIGVYRAPLTRAMAGLD